MSGKPVRTRRSKKGGAGRKPYDKDEPENAPFGSTSATQRLSAQDELDKDDEERELESLLFGKKKTSSAGGRKGAFSKGGAQEEDVVLDQAGLGHVQDADLFFVDAPATGASASHNPLDDPFSDDEQNDQLSHLDSASEDDDNDDEGEEDLEADTFTNNVEEEEDGYSSSSSSGSSSSSSSSHSSNGGFKSKTQSSSKKSKARKPAWFDPDDALVQVSLSTDKRLRKLRRGVEEDVVGGKDLESRLRTQFESLNPRPKWASLSSSSNSNDPLQSLLSSSSPFIASSKGRLGSALPAGQLDIERVRDVKGGEEGGVRALEWAPGQSRSVLAVAGGDRRVRVYNIDGSSNPLLSTIHVPSLPITTLTFHPLSPSTLLLTGPRPYMHLLSLATSTSTRLPLFPESSSSSTEPTPKHLSNISFSPTGELLAAASSSGVHLVSFGQGGPQGLMGTLKGSGGRGGVKGLKWARGGRELWVLGGEGGEVGVWDVGERRCVGKWKDDGGSGWGAGLLEGSEAGGLAAVGSTTGIVNLYSTNPSSSSSSDLYSSNSKPSNSVFQPPKLLKSFTNITTPLSTLKFNPDGQILAAASKDKKDCLKLYHTPSLTTFQNWPTASTPLGHVTALGWSPRSDHLAMGNQRGKVLIYRLRGYGGY